MTPSFESLLQQLKQLPGLGFRSAERIAMHLLVEKPTVADGLIEALAGARESVGRCDTCGNIAESEDCAVCGDPQRDASAICIVEHVPDLTGIERSGVWKGR